MLRPSRDAQQTPTLHDDGTVGYDDGAIAPADEQAEWEQTNRERVPREPVTTGAADLASEWQPFRQTINPGEPVKLFSRDPRRRSSTLIVGAAGNILVANSLEACFLLSPQAALLTSESSATWLHQAEIWALAQTLAVEVNGWTEFAGIYPKGALS